MRRVRALLVVLLAAASCSDTSSVPTTTLPPATTTSTTTATTSAPSSTAPPTTLPTAPGDVVVTVDAFTPFTFNPLQTDPGVPRELGELLLAGALRLGAGGEHLPYVATEVPTVANGGVLVHEDGSMDVTYTVHPDAAWSDGTPITVDDFVFTFQLFSEDLTLAPFARRPYDLAFGIATAGDRVTVTFGEATIEYLGIFDVLVPKHVVEGTDIRTEWDTEPWPSAGPFVLEAMDERLVPGARLTFVANEHYWLTDAAGDPLPRLERVLLELQGDPEVTEQRFASGDLSVWDVPPWQPLLDFAAQHGTVDATRSPIWEHFTFNFGSNNANTESLNANVNYRRAVAHAIDREALITDSPWAAREVLDSPFQLYGEGDRAWQRYEHDPAKARELLTVACTEEGRDCEADPPRLVFSTTSNADERPRIGQLVVEQLRAVGIDAEFDPHDSSFFFGDTLDAGTFDLGMWAWVISPGLPSIAATAALYDPEDPPIADRQGINYSRYGTPAVIGADNDLLNQPESIVRDENTALLAELIDLLQKTADEADVRGGIVAIEELLADQVVFIPLTARGQAVAYRDVVGVVAEPGLPITWNVEEWELP